MGSSQKIVRPPMSAARSIHSWSQARKAGWLRQAIVVGSPSERICTASGWKAPNRLNGSPPNTSPTPHGSIQLAIPRSAVIRTIRATESGCQRWSNSLKQCTTYVQPDAAMSSRSAATCFGARESKYATPVWMPSAMLVRDLAPGGGPVRPEAYRRRGPRNGRGSTLA